jgi:lysophospholipase L1-like esterase
MMPKVAVILIGTNNAGAQANNPPEQIAEGIGHIIGSILTRSPDTQILLQAIFPRGARKPDEKNRQVNALITAFHDGDRVHFIDFTESFRGPNHVLSREAMPDLLHLSPRGYQIWADAIRAPLAGLMQ